jgi:hypothetical protein
MALEDIDWSLWTFTPNLLLVNFGEEAEQVTKRRRKHTAVVVNRCDLSIFMVVCFGY